MHRVMSALRTSPARRLPDRNEYPDYLGILLRPFCDYLAHADDDQQLSRKPASKYATLAVEIAVNTATDETVSH